MKVENEADYEPMKDMGDQFVEFATEEFIHKNIRVRPISGVTADPTNDGRASNVSRANEDAQDGNENETKLQEFHIEDMRKAAKEQRQRNQDVIDRKKALEEKKAQKKN
jgi:phosphatidate phosphatase PAH1